MSNVVDHEHASLICQFVMVSVVNLQDSMLVLALYIVKRCAVSIAPSRQLQAMVVA